MRNIVYESQLGTYFQHEKTDVEKLKKTPTVKHSHPQHEIYLLKSGDVNYYINGTKYRIQKNDLVIVNAYEYHLVEVLPTEDYERYVIQFPVDFIPNIDGTNLTDGFFRDNPYILILPNEYVEKSKIEEIFTALETLCVNADKYLSHAFLSNVISLCIEISKLKELMRQENVTVTEKAHVHPAVSKCIQFINANIYQKITIDDCAKNSAISKSRLQHLFKETIGMSVSDYVLKQKMQTANYLINTGKTPYETASLLSYEYYSTFFSSYKKFFGYRPKKQYYYRQNQPELQKK